MKNDKVIIRRKDRTLMKGRVHYFDPAKTFFSMKLISGERARIDIEDIKAVFIVKDFNGNKDYTYLYKDVLLWGGIKIRITFLDGEVMIGYIPYHINGHNGFFVTPADLGGNNKRVFVVKSATREITYL